MTTTPNSIAMALPESRRDVPVWLHILPAGTFRGDDGRGPFHLRDPDAVIRASMTRARGKLVLDENHATDHAQVKGGSAPAIGWIVEMQSRDDGLWGRVDWNRSGRQLMTDRSYRDVSPVFDSTADGSVVLVVRACLTNTPNLTLRSIHTKEPSMDLADQRRLLGLPDSATQEECDRAFADARAARSLHTQLAQALGADAGTDMNALLASVRAATGASQAAETQRISALQTENRELRERASRAEIDALMDRASADGAVIDESMRGNLRTLHTSNPTLATGILSGLPRTGLATTTTMHTRQPGPKPDAMLARMCADLGVDVTAAKQEMERRNASGR